MKSRSLLAAIFTLTLFPVLAPVVRAADAEPAPENPRVTEAKLSVSGLGLWRNRELRVALQRLLGDQRSATLDANAVEDAAFLLMSALPQGRLQVNVAIIVVWQVHDHRVISLCLGVMWL
jgi:hypothetical protein